MRKKGLGELRTNSIEIEFDEETQDYYIIWKPIVIGSGKTREEALEDLKGAAHYGVDTLIDLKLRDNEGKWLDGILGILRKGLTMSQ